MSLQSNKSKIAYPKSCQTASLGTLSELTVVTSLEGKYALVEANMNHFIQLEFIPIEKWELGEWGEKDVINISMSMEYPDDEQEFKYVIDDAEDILDAYLRKQGSYTKYIH